MGRKYRMGVGFSLWYDASVSEPDWSDHIVNMLTPTGLFSLKWLILCFINFAVVPLNV